MGTSLCVSRGNRFLGENAQGSLLTIAIASPYVILSLRRTQMWRISIVVAFIPSFLSQPDLLDNVVDPGGNNALDNWSSGDPFAFVDGPYTVLVPHTRRCGISDMDLRQLRPRHLPSHLLWTRQPVTYHCSLFIIIFLLIHYSQHLLQPIHHSQRLLHLHYALYLLTPTIPSTSWLHTRLLPPPPWSRRFIRSTSRKPRPSHLKNGLKSPFTHCSSANGGNCGRRSRSRQVS